MKSDQKWASYCHAKSSPFLTGFLCRSPILKIFQQFKRINSDSGAEAFGWAVRCAQVHTPCDHRGTWQWGRSSSINIRRTVRKLIRPDGCVLYLFHPPFHFDVFRRYKTIKLTCNVLEVNQKWPNFEEIPANPTAANNCPKRSSASAV